MTRTDLLRESLLACPVVKRGDYDYFVHPVTDGLPNIGPALLEEVAGGIMEIADMDCDKILTAEAMGIPIATALSLKTGLPAAVIRKRRYGLPSERSVRQITGYSRGDLWIYRVFPGERVIFVDDVLSTGGTLVAIVRALEEMGVALCDIVVAVNKTGPEKKAGIEKAVGMPIKSLVDIDIVDGKVVILK